MALRLIKISPKKALNKAFLKLRPLRSEIDLFKVNLITLLGKVNEAEREENQKNHIRDFLRDTYYKGSHEINTKGTQDLVIHTDKSDQSSVGVIIEAKRPSNKIDWISPEKPNAKALHELVLYYMRERVDGKNIDIKYLVATNIYEWYIIDASYFEKVFYGNKKFVKQYEEWRDGKKVTKDTSLFYSEVAKPYIDEIDDEVVATYFDIRDYEKELRNDDKTDDKKLIALQKLLSSYHLLRLSFANDSNELNSRFYKELLHIIGLEEVKEGGKQVIKRKSKDSSEGSMIENTINILKTEDVIVRLKNRQIYGETKDDQLYNIALELNLTWINRVLFLKLLEGQLLSYHKNDRKYNFLNTDIVFDYDEIYKLFHQVLAKTKQERSGSIIEKYQWVPYLNSSLFEISDLENQTIKINSLDDHAKLDVLNGSILSHLKNASINPLQYLFEFLDAYDFASEGVEEVQDDNRTLINASILGKIFEKINGYKDGSIYTPGFITMYMCRQAIRRAVLQKFKDAYGWNMNDFGDIRNYIADRKNKTDLLEFNALINSLRICDPAVGSGHFLVSSLNELVQIKYELGILCDSGGQRIIDYDLTIENDELIVTYSNGDIFEYQIINGKPKSKEDQRLQKTLFHEKQTIIENCLFGVDINPNSVKICRLRLWIELLKNAYYKEDNGYSELETLPNIDINIKCGNSLISRYRLDSDLSKALKSIKYNIEDYRAFVHSYKNCKDREEKRGLEEIIHSIKNNFQTKIGMNDPKKKKLDQKLSELYHRFTGNFLFEPSEPYGGKKDIKAIEKEKLEAEIEKLSAELDEVKNNAVFQGAFEWRFEFPEVLDDDGNFIGFDVVVGNPPYIRHEEIKYLKPQLEKDYKVFNSSADILTYFFELGHSIVKQNGILSFIVSNKFFKVSYGENIRSYLMQNTAIQKIIEFDKLNIFNEATVKVAIVEFTKNQSSDAFKYLDVETYPDDLDQIFQNNYTKYDQALFDGNQWIFQSEKFNSISQKISNVGTQLSDWEIKINFGIKTGLNEAFLLDEEKKNHILSIDPNSEIIIKQVYRGREIEKYYSKPSSTYIIGTYPALKLDIKQFPIIEEHLLGFGLEKLEQTGKQGSRKKSSNKWFETQDTIAFWREFQQPKIIWKRIGSILRFSYDDTGFCSLDSTCIATGKHLKYLVGVLNSKLIEIELNRFAPKTGTGDLIISVQALTPLKIPIPNESQEKEMEVLVDQIIVNKKENLDTSELEAKIDLLVYELYGLTEDEIKIVEANYPNS